MIDIIYVGGPYHSKNGDPKEVDANVQVILEYMQYLWSIGGTAFSPVEAFNRPYKGSLSRDSKFWMQLCNKFLPVCSEVHIVLGNKYGAEAEDRIMNSVGTMAELGYSKLHDMKVVYVVKHEDGWQQYEVIPYNGS